jgi:hypothetical protein
LLYVGIIQPALNPVEGVCNPLLTQGRCWWNYTWEINYKEFLNRHYIISNYFLTIICLYVYVRVCCSHITLILLLGMLLFFIFHVKYFSIIIILLYFVPI